jgi:hypothetical protein
VSTSTLQSGLSLLLPSTPLPAPSLVLFALTLLLALWPSLLLLLLLLLCAGLIGMSL